MLLKKTINKINLEIFFKYENFKEKDTWYS